MARLPRIVVPHQPHYMTQAGNGRQTVFADAEDYLAFLGWMREAARQFKVAIHAYMLLPDRLALLASPTDTNGLGRMMQWIGRHYVPYFNAKYQRTGTLWQGRYKATVIDASQYLLLCSRFIEPAELGKFGMFDFKRFDAIYTVGLEYTRQVLQDSPEPVEA